MAITTKLNIKKADAEVTSLVTLTSGMIGAQCELHFSQEWEGLEKVAVFTAGEVSIDVAIDSSELDCVIGIPHEVLATPRKNLVVGFYGVKVENIDGDDVTTIAIPTIYCVIADPIKVGTEISNESEGTATPSLVEQMLQYAQDTRNNAEDALDNLILEAGLDTTDIGTQGVAAADVELVNLPGGGKKLLLTLEHLKGNSGAGISRIEKASTSGLVDTYTIYFDDNRTTTFDVTNGAAGSITEVTASVDNNVGTPSVDVTLGGTGNQRTIDLAFHNMKGRDGTGSGDMLASVYDPAGGEKQVAFDDDVVAIEEKIPAQAASSNQLADKNFVNSSIENIAAYYITKDAAGNPFSTKAELNAATTFYSGGIVRVPTRNDYCVVLADESKTITETGENPTTRYIYDNNTWSYQYIVNRSGLTAAQWATVNSGLTAEMIPSGASSSDPLVKHSQLPTSSTFADFTAVITTNWTGTEAPYTQDITINGLLATDKPIVGLVPDSIFSTVEAEISDYAKIYDIQTSDNKITVYTTEPTKTNLTIQMRCIR